MGNTYTDMQALMQCLQNSINTAVIDTLHIIPLLLITYIILEFIEHKMSNKSKKILNKAGVAGPAIGALIGSVPQCGFSGAASTFYAGRVITIGTLMSVYLSTSDEMIPIFIAGKIPIETIIQILIFKVFAGILFGFIIDGFVCVLKKFGHISNTQNFEIHKICKRDHCGCDNNNNIIWPAVLHTIQISLFVLIITILLNILIALFGGEDTLASFISQNKHFSVLTTSIIGLIPNCASSVVISKLYVDGVLCNGALISGLLCATGVGLLILFRTNKPMWHNIIICAILFIISVCAGVIISFIFP